MYLRRAVEDHVRAQLRERHGQEFSPVVLPLRTGGRHEFDAVSADRSIVASVKAASGLTAGGRFPSGKVNTCLAELYYLSLVDAPTRMLVLTTPAFHKLFMKRIAGALAGGLTVECLSLPMDMQREVDTVVAVAAREVTPVLAAQVIAKATETDSTLG